MSSLKIPCEKVIEGIQRMISNAHQYVKDSKILLHCGAIEHSVVSAVFGAEELGKASMLSKKLVEHHEEDEIELPACPHHIHNWLRCHKCKLLEAKNLLGNSLIIESSRVDIARFPFRIGVDDKEAA